MIDIHLPHAGLEWVPGHVAQLFVVAIAIRITAPIYFRKLMKCRSIRKFQIDPVTEYLVTKKKPVVKVYSGPERRGRRVTA